MGIFLICKKVKSKWFAVAETTGDCIANADNKFFEALGVNMWTEGHRVYYKDSFVAQKNFGGFLAEFKTI